MTTSTPKTASFPSQNIVFAAGTATFHIATGRVVLCSHRGYHFLPKGRKNASEPLPVAAVRETFEESGFRSRLLALPVRHRQPVETEGDNDDNGEGQGGNVVEAVWTQLLPVGRGVQYVLLWFIGETVEDVEEARIAEEGRRDGFVVPRGWVPGMTVRERRRLDVKGGGTVYEPIRHEGTGVDEEEREYEARLVPVDEAVRLLRGSVQSEVISLGWELIQRRDVAEE